MEKGGDLGSDANPENTKEKSGGSLLKTMCKVNEFFEDCDRKGFIAKKSSEKSTEFRNKGNELYRQNKHTETHYRMVLSLYSKSLAYAPSESEEFALAASNRSVLWLRLHRYDLCLVDINQALDVTKSLELSSKLQARRVKCSDLYSSCLAAEDDCKELQPMLRRLYSSPKLFKLINDKKPELPRFIDSMKPELPRFTPSKLTPCTADNIKLQRNEKYGRHYIATEDIRPGEILMIEKSSYVSVDFDQIYLVCSHCLAFAWSVMPCEYCVFAVYCSEFCKREAWTQYHDVQCSILPILNSDVHEKKDLSSINELVRMIIIILKEEGIESILKEAENMRGHPANAMSIDTISCGKFKSVYSLMSSKDIENELDIDAQVMTILSLLFKSKTILKNQFHYSQDSMENETMFSLGIIFKKLYLVRKLNSFKFQVAPCVCNDHTMCRIKPDEVLHRGSILGTCSSFFNHSCDPNVSQIFLPGPKIVFFTTRPVKKGEQLFIGYVPTPEWGKESRQERLQTKYSFSCDCKRCKEDWSGVFGISKGRSLASVQLLNERTNKILGKHVGNFLQLPKDWYYDEEVFKGAVKMCEFAHKDYSGHEAHDTSQVFRMYIHRYFFYVYGERVDLI